MLSPTSGKRDRGAKMQAYQNIASVRLVVLVDPGERRFETYERVDDDEWAVGMHLSGTTLAVTDPAFEITAEEMFADD